MCGLPALAAGPGKRDDTMKKVILTALVPVLILLASTVRAEVLVLGVPDAAGEVVLLTPDLDVPVGGRMY